jgi:hypothetical protein
MAVREDGLVFTHSRIEGRWQFVIRLFYSGSLMRPPDENS